MSNERKKNREKSTNSQFSNFKEKTRRPSCTSNLRTIYVGHLFDNITHFKKTERIGNLLLFRWEKIPLPELNCTFVDGVWLPNSKKLSWGWKKMKQKNQGFFPSNKKTSLGFVHNMKLFYKHFFHSMKLYDQFFSIKENFKKYIFFWNFVFHPKH